MEKKIILTDEQKSVIEKQIKGEYNPLTASEEETNILRQVIRDAKNLVRELDAFDEVESLTEWYFNKYKEQQAS